MRLLFWNNQKTPYPLAEKTLDPYGYCYNNPIRLIDPTGMIGGDEETITKSKDAISHLETALENNKNEIHEIKREINELNKNITEDNKRATQRKINNKNKKINKINKESIEINIAKLKINKLLEDKNFTFYIKDYNGNDDGTLREKGTVCWGNYDKEVVSKNTGDIITIIHELVHVYDIYRNPSRVATPFLKGAQISFYGTFSEVNAYKVNFSLGDNELLGSPANIEEINDKWYKDNYLK